MSNRLTVRRARPDIIPLFKAWVTRRLKEERERYRSVRYGLYDDYGDEYDEEMAALRRYYGGVFPRSGSYILNPLDDEDADEWDDDDYDDLNYDDYYVGDDGEIIFPSGGVVHNRGSEDSTLRPGQTRRSIQDMDDYWNKMSKFNEGGKKKKHRKHRGKKKGAKVIDISQPYDANYIDDGEALENCTIYFYEDYHDKYDRTEFNSLYEFDKYCQEMGFVVPSYIAEAIAYSPVSHCCLSPAAKEQGILEIMREETYGDLFYEACDSSELSST